jgi:hypothetical protein
MNIQKAKEKEGSQEKVGRGWKRETRKFATEMMQNIGSIKRTKFLIIFMKNA